MYDIIIIGAGPAGLNAALYALRGGKKVLILEANNVGGQIANSPSVENFPTYKSISGLDFAMQFAQQVEEWGGELEYEKVLAIDKNYQDNIFTVTTEYNTYRSFAIICALGVSHKHINAPGECELTGKGVHYCATCDGAFYENREVALIGDGNTAMQYALLLSKICSKVYLLTWMDKFFGDKVTETAVRNNSKIEHIPYSSVIGFKGVEALESITYLDMSKDQHTIVELAVPGVFIAIGQVPNNDIISKFTKLDSNGFVTPNTDMSTETSGLFVAGDCIDKAVKQVATAISDGAIAAISACNYLNKFNLGV